MMQSPCNIDHLFEVCKSLKVEGHAPGEIGDAAPPPAQLVQKLRSLQRPSGACDENPSSNENAGH